MLRRVFIFLVSIVVLASCEEIINEINISNDTIPLVAPTNDAILPTNTRIFFDWERIEGANTFRLQIARPSFDAAVQIELDTTIAATTFSIDSLKVNDYQWRVKGLNSSYETEYTTNTFKVE